MSENKNHVEQHGCIVCAKTYSVLAVYTPQGKLLGCTVTSPGAHILPDERQALVVCDNHSPDQIESAYKRWSSNRSNPSGDQQADE